MGPRRRSRAGFTLIEVAVVGLLTALLAAVLVSAWSAFYRSAAEVAARGQLAREADFAIARIARDLAGDGPGRLVGVREGIDTFELCFDDDDDDRDGLPSWGPPDAVVRYSLGDRAELRRVVVTDDEPDELVARHAGSIDVYAFGGTDWLQFDVTFRHPVEGLEPGAVRGAGGRIASTWLERTYSLIARVP